MNGIDPRFAALTRRLEAVGALADGGPVSQMDYVPPDGVRVRWRAGVDRAEAQAIIDGWDWSEKSDAARAAELAAWLLEAGKDKQRMAAGLALAMLRLGLTADDVEPPAKRQLRVK